MRDKHFIAWLVGLLVVPFVLHAYAATLNGLATSLPEIMGGLGALIASAVAFSLLTGDGDDSEERDHHHQV